MIWIFWTLFIVAECLLHWYFIEIKHKDVTPDGKITFRHVIAVSARFIVFIALSALLKHPSIEAYYYFCFGALSLHLLIFGPLLNALRGKSLRYLGNGLVDKFLNLTPSFFFRIFGLVVISSGMIAGYYQWY
jgi:hypothetical protein